MESHMILLVTSILQQRIITSRKGMEGTRGKGKYKAKGAQAGCHRQARTHQHAAYMIGTRVTLAQCGQLSHRGGTHTQPSLSRRTPEAAAVVRAPHRLVPRLPPLLLALRFVLPPASFLRSEASVPLIVHKALSGCSIELARQLELRTPVRRPPRLLAHFIAFALGVPVSRLRTHRSRRGRGPYR